MEERAEGGEPLRHRRGAPRQGRRRMLAGVRVRPARFLRHPLPGVRGERHGRERPRGRGLQGSLGQDVRRGRAGEHHPAACDDRRLRRGDGLLSGRGGPHQGGPREGLLDVDRPVRTEVHRLDVAVDRHMGRDDVLPGDLDERLDPGTLEVLVLEGGLVHDALLERPVEGAEGIEHVVSELLPTFVDGLAEARRDDGEEVLRLLLVLPFLDLLTALVLVDGLEGEVDVALLLVHLEDLGDDLLALADVVADVLDPPGADLRDVDEALLGLVLVQGDECAEVLHVRHGADDQVALVGPVVAARGGRLRLRHYSRTPRISPRIAAFPPVGFATVAPQTGQRTTLAARSNTICTLPQSSHLTRRNWLVGFGITCAPPRARTSSRGCRAAGGPCGIPDTGTADGSASSASRGPRASVGESHRTPRSPVETGAGPPAVRTAGGS